MKKTVITGMDAITPLDNIVKEFWHNLVDGKLGVGKTIKFDSEDTGVTLVGEVKEFDPSVVSERKEQKGMDLFSQYGLVAALEAWEMSGLTEAMIDPTRLGAIVGGRTGRTATLQDQVRAMDKKGTKRVIPFFVPMVTANMVAGNISIRLGAKRPSQTIVTTCASATNVTGEAFRAVRYGLTDMMVTGGTEATVCEIGTTGFVALSTLNTAGDATRTSTPFDKEWKGFVIGKGTGMLTLEELEYTQKCGATIYNEIAEYGSDCDASHMTAPLEDGSGTAAAMEMAIAEAGTAPEQIGCINVHGTSIPANDTVEITAIKRVSDEQAPQIPISSTKSVTGHLLDAAGGIEAVARVQILQEGKARPTVGYQVADPNCNLDYVTEGTCGITVDYTVNNPFGSGGRNGVVCLKKWEED